MLAIGGYFGNQLYSNHKYTFEFENENIDSLEFYYLDCYDHILHLRLGVKNLHDSESCYGFFYEQKPVIVIEFWNEIVVYENFNVIPSRYTRAEFEQRLFYYQQREQEKGFPDNQWVETEDNTLSLLSKEDYE